jgi:hypothetical protein
MERDQLLSAQAIDCENSWLGGIENMRLMNRFLKDWRENASQ